MSTTPGYHPSSPGAGAPYDDRDSDIDLDLNEHDPHTSSEAASSRRQPGAWRSSYEFGGRIPLRNLRFGGRRRPRDADAEDLEALVGDDEDARKRESGTSSGADGDDNAPLLAGSGGAGRYSEQASHEPPTGRSKGLWRFLPFRSNRNTSIHLHSAAPADDEEPDSSISDPASTRTIPIAHPPPVRHPPNSVSNAKYTAYSFLPLTLFHEFKFFFNMYFLLVALSQIIPALRIGYLSTYIAPLLFVLTITLSKEALDDVSRRRRDGEINGEAYKVLKFEEGGRARANRGMRNGSTKQARKISKKRRAGGEDNAQTLTDGDEQDGMEELRANVKETMKQSKDLKVGDVVVMGKDQRVPADVVVLKSFSTETHAAPQEAEAPAGASTDAELLDIGEGTGAPDAKLQQQALRGQSLDDETTTSDPSGGGEAFIRTDQLDGETDWKLRLASPLTQSLPPSEYGRLRVIAGKPEKRVNDFIGTIELLPRQAPGYDPHVDSKDGPEDEESTPNISSLPLTIDNTAWANTVMASSTIVHAVVVYTGPQTRAALSTSPSRSKTGLLELEINSLVKILCILTATLSLVLVALKEGLQSGSTGDRPWYVAVMRFLILFSTIVPISLRVNLDLGKSVYAWFIHHDKDIPGTVVRTSTIPEDLGRIEYLLSDKTGTLTRNEMALRKVHVGTVSYGGEAMEEVAGYIKSAFAMEEGELFTPTAGIDSLSGATRTRREIGLRVRDLVLALALCHNVTPTTDEDEDGQAVTAYQASSPDEIAIVQWTEQVGLRLTHRDRKSISLQSTFDDKLVVKVEILNVFPFTSDSKRMGVIARFTTGKHDDGQGEIVFFQKGADTVMTSIVASNDWLDEETGNMAREGLRTLVIGRKNLSAQQYNAFLSAHTNASISLSGRDAAMTGVVKQHLEHDLELLGVTGVEDKLQDSVKPSLELLRNAGIKIWMLTGDKVETARCVAISSKLVSRGQPIHTISGLKRKEAALDALGPLHGRMSSALLIDGQSLTLYLAHHRDAFVALAVRLPAVIACRCSPTQKADLALLIRAYTGKRIACIGDGGNDVSMIAAADVGVGIEGKEGRQASLAADFSITQFAHLTKLLVWHGRNSYKRSAKLAQFVIHRGLLISVAQTVFSVASAFAPIALYRDFLLVGYATVYTMMPVFSLTLDRDVDERLANLYPELYRELTSGRSLSYRTFFVWAAISLYQGLIIQGGSQLLLPSFASAAHDSDAASADPTHTQPFQRMVALSFTALILNELLMVAAEITTWHPINIATLLGTGALYFGTVPALGGYFDLGFVIELGFWWRVAAVVAASVGPVWVGKCVGRRVRPASYRKVRGV